MSLTWTAKTLLDHVQHLTGQPVGGFYNISTRLGMMNAAQDELVRETRALTKKASLDLDSDSEVAIPSDFLTFTQVTPYWEDGSDYAELDVVSFTELGERYPKWQDASEYSADDPRVLITSSDGTSFMTFPKPASGTLNITYVVQPERLTDLEDEPFNGRADLNAFAVALAYKVANVLTLPHSPDYATRLQAMYIQELKKMRHATRVNPQKPQTIRPRVGRSRRTLAGAIARWRDT